MSAPLRQPNIEGKPFGKYQLLDCIAESVMSKVYRARLTIGKTNRIVVLKTLHPRFLTDQKSRDLFHREIQTSMNLAHANIVQIHDFGEEEGCPFIVMEWIHGRTLKEVVAAEQKRAKSGLVPLIACHIIEQAAQGLEHAHSFKDKLTGETLSIIHRDLSPHNLILGFNGSVKLIDFGIARMAHQDSDTMSDQVWGKAGYFSPEQAAGQKLDRRSDLFALGAVFFELLSGKKIFYGENNLASLQKIQTTDVHTPKMIAHLKGLPLPLAQIITKCLRSNRNERFSTAEEVAKSLRDYIASQKKEVDASVVARYLEILFPGESEVDRAKLRDSNERSSSWNMSEFTSSTDSQSIPSLEQIEATPYPAPAIASETILNVDEVVTLDRSAPVPAQGPEPAGLFTTGGLFKRTPPTAAVVGPAPVVSSAPTPTPAPHRGSLGVMLGVALLGVLAVLGVAWNLTREQGVSRAVLKLQPQLTTSTEILLDGKTIKLADDLLPAMGLGEAHRLEIQRPGFVTLVKDIRVLDSTPIELTLIPLHQGSLSLKTVPIAVARITDGKNLWIQETPILRLALPPGDYRIYLSAEGGKERTITVTIDENTPLTVSERL